MAEQAGGHLGFGEPAVCSWCGEPFVEEWSVPTRTEERADGGLTVWLDADEARAGGHDPCPVLGAGTEL